MSAYDDDEDDEPQGDKFDNSHGLHFSIDFDLANNRVSQKERDALRKLILSMVTEATVKCGFIIEPSRKALTVTAEERSTSYGMRRMRPPREDTHG